MESQSSHLYDGGSLKDVMCDVTSMSLSECSHSGWDTNICDIGIAAVSCSKPINESSTSSLHYRGGSRRGGNSHEGGRRESYSYVGQCMVIYYLIS